MIVGEPMPFEEALQFAQRKQPLPTSLSSADLRTLDAALKRRAIFSARVGIADHLQRLAELVAKIAGGITEQGATAGTQFGDDRMLSIPEAKAQLLEFLNSIDYEPTEEDRGTIKDLRSDSRLQLQVETNVLDTLGFGRWKSGQDEVALDVNPAWELVRVRFSAAPRDWEARWSAARAEAGPEGTTAGGRMVALKNHPIWQALGDGAGGYEDTLGNPWPPFAFNSGMGVLDVPRDEAIELGLLNDLTVVPPEENEELNGSLEVDADRFDIFLQRQLAKGPDLMINADGVLTLR